MTSESLAAGNGRASCPGGLVNSGPSPSPSAPLISWRASRVVAHSSRPCFSIKNSLRGLGNIYADESLFLARLHPKLSAAKLGPQRAKRLHAAIQRVLKSAIAAGGSTISDYVDSQGSQGYFQLQTNVYGKTGEPCKVCKTPLRRTIVASRSTHFCPRCQKR